MCNGFSTRASQGGAIAILKPSENMPGTDYHITLQETTTPGNHLTGQIQKQDSDVRSQDLKSCWLEIHPDGDLIPSSYRDSLPVLHRLPLSRLMWQDRSSSSSAGTAVLDPLVESRGANHGINLTVGDDGVIGRRMSMVDGKSGSRLAEGVIGWN